MNVRGLWLSSDRSKVSKVGAMAINAGCMAIVLTETWLEEGVRDQEIVIPGFTVYRADRLDRERGGVCMYMREDISVNVCWSYSNSVTEGLVLKIRDLDTLLVGIYRPPDTQPEEFKDIMSRADQAIKMAQAHGKYGKVVTMGDFNMKEINWSDGSRNTGTSSAGAQRGILFGFMDDHFMEQLVREPTREENILDLVMENAGCIESIAVEVGGKLSDHNSIMIRTNLTAPLVLKKTAEYNYRTVIQKYKVKDQSPERN